MEYVSITETLRLKKKAEDTKGDNQSSKIEKGQTIQ
jgi:hypothetical protein